MCKSQLFSQKNLVYSRKNLALFCVYLLLLAVESCAIFCVLALVSSATISAYPVQLTLVKATQTSNDFKITKCKICITYLKWLQSRSSRFHVCTLVYGKAWSSFVVLIDYISRQNTVMASTINQNIHIALVYTMVKFFFMKLCWKLRKLSQFCKLFVILFGLKF